MEEKKEDQYFLDQVIGGDAGAFAALVDRYKNMIFTLALKMIRNREEAEEIAQDTFIKAYKSLHSFKGKSKFSTWLYRIGYNLCLDHLKKMKKVSGTIALEEMPLYFERSFVDLADTENGQDINQQVQYCLEKLPADDAFLITLYYYDDLSLGEIAAVMDSNANQIKVRLFRIRKKLASLLKNHLTPGIITYYEKERR